MGQFLVSPKGQFTVSLENPEKAALARRRPALPGENGGSKNRTDAALKMETRGSMGT